MQEEVTQRSIALTTRAAKLTKGLLVKMVSAALRKMRQKRHEPHHGRQSVKQLARHNAGMQTIEITNDNIKSFERVARKYGVDFALRRDDSVSPPKWMVFFKARDADALTATFKEFTVRSVKRGADRPSVLDALHQAQRHVRVRTEPVRNKQKELAI